MEKAYTGVLKIVEWIGLIEMDEKKMVESLTERFERKDWLVLVS